jgi:type IV pilus assembly protein PilA
MTIQPKHYGFTLIELMIVVTIIGILAAIASPTYQRFTERARFTQVTSATSAIKSAVEICAQVSGDIAQCSGGSNGIPSDILPAQDIVGITTSNGIISATKALNLRVPDPGTFTLTPVIQTNGTIIWQTNCDPMELC